MENASKALLMAGGILILILILALMVTLFVSSRNLSNQYEATKQTEAIQQFNVNFTKYVGKKITAHEAVTLCNFAKIENNKVRNVIVNQEYTPNNILQDIKEVDQEYATHLNESVKIQVLYDLKIEGYQDGYVSQISIGNRTIVVTPIQ